MRNALALVLGTTALLSAHAASADVLTIASVESGSWNDTLTALRADAGSQGRALHVVARDDSGRAVACGGYSLVLGAASTRAFAEGPCDAATGATEVRLVDRAALFDADHRPLAATAMATTVAAAPPATDPSQRPAPQSTRVAAVTTAAPSPTTSLQVLPAIVADASGGTCATAPELLGGSVMMGSTLNASRRPLYAIRLAQPTTVRIVLSSDFGGEVDFHRGCPARRARVATSMVFGGGPSQRLEFDLAPGVYYVSLIDADIHTHAGEFAMETQVEPDYLAAMWGR